MTDAVVRWSSQIAASGLVRFPSDELRSSVGAGPGASDMVTDWVFGHRPRI